jgi:TolB-like protein
MAFSTSAGDHPTPDLNVVIFKGLWPRRAHYFGYDAIFPAATGRVKNTMPNLFSELKRRNVFRVAIAYIIAAWLLLQVADVVLNNIEAPDWVFKTIMLLVAIGFPFAMILAWAFELTPDGLKKEKDVDRSESITRMTGRKLDIAIFSVMALGLIYLTYDKFAADDTTNTAAESSVVQADDTLAAESAERSIAVLPFVNMSSDPEQEFFSDGISEELLNVLAQLPDLRVAARTSSFQFKGMNQDIAKIAATLNVAHVLEGSVRKSGSKLRITAQLIKADDGFHLWSNTYDREVVDIFAVQDEIAQAITDALKIELALNNAGAESAQPSIIKAANTDAYEAYLRGRQLIHRRGRVSLEAAVRDLELALRLDNDFAPAHAQLAIATALLMESPESYGILSQEEVRRIAIPHLDRAQELQPNLAEAFAGRALLALDTGELDYSVQQANKALAINPSYTDALNWKYLALAALGRYEDQEAAMLKILEIDPMTIIGRMNYAGWLGSTGRASEGHKVADQLLETSLWGGYSRHAEMALSHEGDFYNGLSWGLRSHVEDPGDNFTNVFVLLGFTWIDMFDEARRISEPLSYLADVAEGRFDEAIRKTERKLLLDPNNQTMISALANTLYEAGRIDEALPHFERLREFEPEGRPIDSSSNSMMRLALARRKTNDLSGAQAAAEIARQDHAALMAVGAKNQYHTVTEASIAAFDNDADQVVALLELAMQRGMRNPRVFADPVFEGMWDDPRFIALQQELDTILIGEREKVLQLVCFNNPAPAGWQPLPATCEGVTEQLEL